MSVASPSSETFFPVSSRQIHWSATKLVLLIFSVSVRLAGCTLPVELSNNNEYYIVLGDGTADCKSSEYRAITSKEECLLAGEAIGGIPHPNTGTAYAHKDWVHTPCGCFLSYWDLGGTDSGWVIHFDIGRTECKGDYVDEYPVICKRAKWEPGDVLSDFYSLEEDGTAECSTDLSIASAKECLGAGLSIGASVEPDSEYALVNSWGHTPCGCFLSDWGKHGWVIHYDTKEQACVGETTHPTRIYPVLCRKKDYTQEYHQVVNAIRDCSQYRLEGMTVTAVQSEEECMAAGLSLGGTLRFTFMVAWFWTHTPCGCFIQMSADGSNGDIHWNYGETCQANPEFQVICQVTTSNDIFIDAPTSVPTSVPTSGPTFGPTSGPTFGPTSGPTFGPTLHAGTNGRAH